MGEATAAALRAIRTLFPHSPHAPRDVRGGGGGGAESGTSEKLARFVVADLGGGAAGARLLYLTGDKNRDTLAAVVREAGVALESVQVYATQGSSRFEEDLRGALQDLGWPGESFSFPPLSFVGNSYKWTFLKVYGGMKTSGGGSYTSPPAPPSTSPQYWTSFSTSRERSVKVTPDFPLMLLLLDRLPQLH